jgi:phosphate:Na+ symporter
MLREAIGGTTAERSARHQQIVTGLNLAIADFITRLNRNGMSPEGAQRLPAILRIARYYETLAELALELVAASGTHLSANAAESAKFTAQAEALLDAVDPSAKLDDSHAIEPALQALEEHYHSLKSQLLEAGAQGQMPVAEMDARLRIAGAIRHAAQQAVKAALMLNAGTTAVQPDKAEGTSA